MFTITILHVSAITVCLSIRSCLVESYKKKTKLELQRSIKSLKDDNAMFTKLNQDLRRILGGYMGTFRGLGLVGGAGAGLLGR